MARARVYEAITDAALTPTEEPVPGDYSGVNGQYPVWDEDIGRGEEPARCPTCGSDGERLAFHARLYAWVTAQEAGSDAVMPCRDPWHTKEAP
jgi:hypothetical protein